MSIDFASRNKEPSPDSTDSEDTEKHEGAYVVGTSIDIVILGINSNTPIKGKIDTGADQSSLGVTELSVTPNPAEPDKQIVKFTFNNSQYNMDVAHMQGVQSADSGVNYRPVITVSAKYKTQLLEKVELNLNDRTSMPDQLLIGMNLLKEFDVLIDPNVSEGISLEFEPTDTEQNSPTIPSDIEPGVDIDVDIDDTPYSEDPVKQILAIIEKHPEITLKQLLTQVTTEAIQSYLPQ
jgi:hypothetical protein